jgi:hypothetical protein
MTNTLRFCPLLLVFICFSNPAYAYLDPGTGSIILQAFIAVIVSCITLISSYWKKIKFFFSRKESKSNHSENNKN